MQTDLRKGFSLIEISLSLGILIVAAAVGYYYFYFLPQQNSVTVKIPISQTQAVQSQPQQQVQPQPQPAAPSGFHTVTVDLGKPFVVDNVQYTVQDALNLGSNLSKYPQNMGMGQSSGGTFVLVKFVADNLGTTQTALTNTSFFIANPTTGAEYNQESEFTNGVYYQVPGYSILDQQSWQPTSVKPAIPVDLYIIAEVPAGAHGLGMVIANQKDQNYLVPLGL